jgi:hypothetical protein
MGAPISVRRRLAAGQSVRLSQPMFWGDGMNLRFLASSTNITVTASATLHTVGSWTQIIADTATTETAGLLMFFANSTTAAATDTGMLLDIGTGAAASEVVRVQSLAISQQATCHTAIPIRIPGSTRLAARIQSSVASRTLSGGFALFATPFSDRLPLSVDVIGTSTATSVGTAMSGASGTWVEITAATTKDYQAIVLVPSLSDTNSGANVNVRYDLGIGASGSEVAVASAQFLYTTTPAVGATNTASIAPGLGGVFGGFVPAGTRVSVRHNIAANPGRLDACVIGVPYV